MVLVDLVSRSGVRWVASMMAGEKSLFPGLVRVAVIRKISSKGPWISSYGLNTEMVLVGNLRWESRVFMCKVFISLGYELRNMYAKDICLRFQG